jgi:hypothetical protein
MLGDLLLTRECDGPGVDLPTDVGAASPMRTKFADLRQKVFLLSPDIAVAWAGFEFLAQSILREVKERFRPPLYRRQTAGFH